MVKNTKNSLDRGIVRNHQILHNIILYSVFALYLLILFALLFMKKQSFRSVSLVPFRSIAEYLSDEILRRSFALGNLLGNVVLFVPLGGYLTLFNRDKRIFTNVLWIVLISAAAEALQYLFRVGATDIDDVILNGLGGFIGVAAYRILLLVFKDTEKVRTAIEIIAPVTGAVFFLALFIYNTL